MAPGTGYFWNHLALNRNRYGNTNGIAQISMHDGMPAHSNLSTAGLAYHKEGGTFEFTFIIILFSDVINNFFVLLNLGFQKRLRLNKD